ncbi:DUF4405 domain-containing protein [Jiella sonneratiae]|uniref:DUF4405 domain-containing protein n=1 Tax=Jiella sonneratiae TaxID=2816856 RepID=A0ABS3J477_9HYPH|nr:DUF4405 domain-containing protein [Jiella sonneratiae]MBO0903371.1 DUF4405 domain-containing protein [Jiella sonneratiae]
MPNLLKRYATPFVTGLFVVSLISGIALFFHTGPGALHPVHEWLSMVLILPFVLHLWRNWRAFSTYFPRAPMAIALCVSAVATLAFFVPAGGETTRGGPPQFAFAETVVGNGTPASVAPVLGLSVDDVTARLQKAGFTDVAAEKPLGAIANASGRSTADVLRALSGSPAAEGANR